MRTGREAASARPLGWGAWFRHEGRRWYLTLSAETHQEAVREMALLRPWLDRAEHISALLDAAGELDRTARVRRGQRRALIATLVFAGLRLGEALALRWGDVDLARGTLRVDRSKMRVDRSKTDAGIRTVNILPALRDELIEYKTRFSHTSDELVFATTTGRALGGTNVRKRIMESAVARASEKLKQRGLEGLPVGITPHSLRRTFASLLFALGESPPYVMSQMGHTTAGLTLALYAREMSRRDGESARLRMLVEGKPRTTASVSQTHTSSTLQGRTGRQSTTIRIDVPTNR